MVSLFRLQAGRVGAEEMSNFHVAKSPPAGLPGLHAQALELGLPTDPEFSKLAEPAGLPIVVGLEQSGLDARGQDAALLLGEARGIQQEFVVRLRARAGEQVASTAGAHALTSERIGNNSLVELLPHDCVTYLSFSKAAAASILFSDS